MMQTGREIRVLLEVSEPSLSPAFKLANNDIVSHDINDQANTLLDDINKMNKLITTR